MSSTATKTTTEGRMTKKKGRAGSLDEHIGTRLRQRRALLGMTQEKLAESVGLTFQQVQKYENGANRISAGRLFEFSQILSVPITYFYENILANKKAIPAHVGMSDGEQSLIKSEDDLLSRKETLELIRVYYSIQDPKLRKNLFNLVKSMAENLKNQDAEA